MNLGGPIFQTNAPSTSSSISDFNEAAQDAIGSILTDTATIDFTYNDASNTITADLKNTVVAAGSYGDASHVPNYTVDAQGRLTAASSTAIAITSSSVTDFNEAAEDAIGGILTDTATIDFTYNDGANTITADLKNTTVTAASYGDASHVSQVTFDAQGRATAASSIAIAITSSAVTDFNEAAQDAVGTILTDSSTIDFTYDDTANTITAVLKDTAVTTGTYGSATAVGQFTVDQQGRITGAAAVNIAISSSAVTDFNEAAQDAVGGILTDTAEVNFTYDDAGNKITADLINNSIVAARLKATATDIIFGRATALAGAGEEIVCTATGRSILDDTSVTAVRTTIGAAASGAVGSSGLTMNTAKLLGRTTASAGAIEEIAVSARLSLSSGTLTTAAESITATTFTMNTAKILGRTTASAGAVEEIAVVSPLSLASTNLTTSMATAHLIGRTTAGTGVMEQLTVSAPLTLAGGALGTSLIAPNSAVVVGASTTTTGTFTIDSGATFLWIEILAAGGGGGAGRRDASLTNRFGGNGGNGGSYTHALFRVADLGVSIIFYSLGKFGAGAAGQITNTTNGANGGTAEDCTLQKTSAGGQLFLYVQGGAGGLGGTSGALTQTSPSANGGAEIGGIGGTAQQASTASGVGSTYYAGQGGGCGQSINNSNTSSTGSLSAGTGFYHTGSSTFISIANSPYSPGGGAAGGTVNTTGNSASTGGFSNVYGAGGGGGGASLNGTTSGGGGDGSPAILRAVWW